MSDVQPNEGSLKYRRKKRPPKILSLSERIHEIASKVARLDDHPEPIKPLFNPYLTPI